MRLADANVAFQFTAADNDPIRTSRVRSWQRTSALNSQSVKCEIEDGTFAAS